MKLLVDFMCGKLVRWLRVLGLDAEYFRETDPRKLLRRALTEERTVITRNTKLPLYPGVSVYLLETEIPEEQVRQVVRDLDLGKSITPFTRCNVCNGELEDMNKEDARGRVPFYTFQTQETFRKCRRCERIYWEGTHVVNMRRYIAEVLGRADWAKGLETPNTEQPDAADS